MAAPIPVKRYCHLLFVKKYSCKEMQQLILGIGNAIQGVIEPYCVNKHTSLPCNLSVNYESTMFNSKGCSFLNVCGLFCIIYLNLLKCQMNRHQKWKMTFILVILLTFVTNSCFDRTNFTTLLKIFFVISTIQEILSNCTILNTQ